MSDQPFVIAIDGPAGAGKSTAARALASRLGFFLLDTGATYCVLAPTAARRMSVKPTGETVDIRTANGTVRAPIVELASIDVGGNRARQVRAIVHPAVAPPLDGIIGLSFLNRFSYGIDPRRRVLRLN